MSDDKKERWTNYLAISTVLIAVCATLSTFKGGGYSTRSLMNQSNASDQWAFFQSKSIKSYIFEARKDNLELEKKILTPTFANKSTITNYDEEIEKLEAKTTKYEQEKAEIKLKAEKFEKDRDDCKLHSSAFGIAVIFLQVSILLSSISALTKKKYIWILSLAVGIVGILYFFNGFFLFM